MPDQGQFREVMGHFATGVTVVTSTAGDGIPCGLTANAVASVSLEPLLLLVCLDRMAATHEAVVNSRHFAVNVLSAGGQPLAERFSRGEREHRFDGVGYAVASTGAPVIEQAMAWLDCSVRDVYEAGDHSVVVGEVVACGAREGDPLIFFRGRFGSGAVGGAE